ncbi:hyaluronan synthase HasA [Nocardioides panacihumi]|uniref:Hyaluronan synthase HasA n=1 Tax=Nocardioides panacihumi TaxID=400774 RepID=A0ABN2QCF3_9ACTN
MSRSRALAIGLLVAIVVIIFTLWSRHVERPVWYGVVLLAYLVGRTLLSMLNRPITAASRGSGRAPEMGHLTVSVVVPFYNEDPGSLRACLDSLLAQSRRPQQVVVVDDGSPDPAAYDVAVGLQARASELGIDLVALRSPVNRGKREGLLTGVDASPAAKIIVGVDSDTVLDPDALLHGLQAFADRRVEAVTGLVLVANHRRNLLTRLTDLRYANAFLVDRGAQSTLGSVLCVCGSLAFYRRGVIEDNRDDFAHQTFLGRPAVAGDDRRLTNYALRRGKVVSQHNAVAWTLAPERLPHFLRQQVRWNRSFVRESIWAVQHLGPRRPAFWFSAMELTSWIMFTVTLWLALVIRPVLSAEFIFTTYLLYSVLLAYARSVRYLEVTRRHVGRWERWGVLAIAPLYALLSIVMLLVVRVWALSTLRNSRWGTRTHVEVLAADDMATHGQPAEARS